LINEEGLDFINKTFRSSILVAVAFILLRFGGFIREAVLAHFYGATYVTDGFVIAYQIPNLFLNFLVSTTATVYISINAGLATHEKQRFSNNLITIFTLIAGIMTVLFLVVPQVFVSLMISASAKEGTRETAAVLLQYMRFSIIPLLLASTFKARPQINEKFFISTVYQIFVNLFIIIGIVLAKPFSFFPLIGIGMIVGNLLSLLVLIRNNRDSVLTYKPIVDFTDLHLRQFIILLTPMILSAVVSEINQIVTKRMASSLDEGLQYRFLTTQARSMVCSAR
jgi:putative peptidoglycan lipid II flippase